MKRTIKQAMIALLFFVLSPLIAQAASVEDELRGIANATQKGLPMKVSDDMQATSMTAAGKALLARYHYMKKSSAIHNVENLKEKFFRNSINSSCTNPDMARLINRGAYLKYEFYDIDNRFVFGYAIDQETCKNSQ